MSTEPVDTELAAIHAVVAAVQHAQRNESVDDFIALFRADAIWTTGHGKRLFGRDAIAEFTATVLPGAMSGGLVPTYEVEHVLFVRPDVVAVKARQSYTVNGEPGTSQGSPLYILTKEAGHWLITAAQNTEVVV